MKTKRTSRIVLLATMLIVLLIGNSGCEPRRGQQTGGSFMDVFLGIGDPYISDDYDFVSYDEEIFIEYDDGYDSFYYDDTIDVYDDYPPVDDYDIYYFDGWKKKKRG